MSNEESLPVGTHGGDVSPRYFFETVLRWMVAICVFALMALTFVDVVGRYVFNAPIPGGFELVEFALALSIFAAYPLIAGHKQHITVGILESLMRKNLVRRIQQLFVLGGTVAMLGFVTNRMWSQARIYHEGAEKTFTLNLPISPVVYLIALFCLLAVFAAGYHFYQYLRRQQ